MAKTATFWIISIVLTPREGCVVGYSPLVAVS
jgi:hypothetical protein